MARERSHSDGRMAKAGKVNRLDTEDLDFYERVRASYLELAAAEPARFRVIDSSGSVASTEFQVQAALAEFVDGEA
jgi:dTMP kinase